MFGKVGVRGRSRGRRRRPSGVCGRAIAGRRGESPTGQVTAVQPAGYVAERAAGYEAGPVGPPAGADVAATAAGGTGDGQLEPRAGGGWSLGEALGLVQAAVDALAGVELDGEHAAGLLEGVAGLQRLVNRLAAQQVRVVGVAERRDAFGLAGSATAAAWLRSRLRLGHGQAVRQVQAARRLAQLPGLRAVFEAGEVTLAHVTAVTDAAVPRRMETIRGCEDTLVDLARQAWPRDVRRAVQAIRDAVDPDGSGSPPLDGRGLDERRHLDVSPTIDGLVVIQGLLDQLQGERLLTLLDALLQLDAADTPERERRSAGQRRADALDEAVRRLLDSGDLPRVQGNKPHVVCTIDLETLLGRDSHAARTPRLRHTGDLDGERARDLARDAKLQAILTLGPWRIVNVGRTQRTLPAWLRYALELVHRHCRGPDCDRPISWTEAHHLQAWTSQGGDTDLNRMVPLCKTHHKMVTTGGWTVDFDPDTGTCTWQGPAGQTIHTHPPTP